MEITKKLFKAEKTSDGILAVISTSDVDRDGDVLDPKGIVLDNYEKNPVVLWAHDHAIPAIGRSLWVKPQAKRVISKPEFANTPFAREIKSLYDDEILSTFSVGFGRRKWEHVHEETRDGYNITEWELYEYSAVNVPANPNALADRAKSLSDETVKHLGLDPLTQAMNLIAELRKQVEMLGESDRKLAEKLETLAGQMKAKRIDYDEALAKLSEAAGTDQLPDIKGAFNRGIQTFMKGK